MAMAIHRTEGKDAELFYSTLPLPPAHKHSDILITLFAFTTLLLNEIYHLTELPSDRLMMQC